MDFFGLSLVSFIFGMGLIVGIHEYGHYITARLLKIKVLEFSIGFGPTVFERVSKKTDIKYKLSAIPLGGYVKMLNKADVDDLSDYSDKDLDMAFDNVPLWKRFLVVFNGPLANFILAFVIYFSISLHGINVINPIVGGVSGISYEYGIQHGDRFTHIDGVKTESWEDVALQMVVRSGKSSTILKLNRDGAPIEIDIDLSSFKLERGDTDIFGKVGIIPAQLFSKNIVKKVISGSPAEKAGLQIGDLILSINNQEVSHFAELSKKIKSLPGEDVKFSVSRNGEIKELETTLGGKKGEGETGMFGFSPDIPSYNQEWYTTKKLTVSESIVYGFDKTVSTTVSTFKFIGKLFNGEIAIDNISGPVSIAKATGQGLSVSISHFFGIIAFLSINIMIINLLPIPALDGGHLFTYVVESVFGPVPEKIQVYSQYVGMGILLLLMLYAVSLDVLDFLIGW